MNKINNYMILYEIRNPTNLKRMGTNDRIPSSLIEVSIYKGLHIQRN